jgi:1-phosphofructokinase family hexose kinase
MILCITPNPAIDRTIVVSELLPGHVHRAQKVMTAAGGKGLNVARAIGVLGGQCVCMGFVGGHAGRLLADLAARDGLRALWTPVENETRSCLILVPSNEDATVVNEPGMPVGAAAWQQLQAYVKSTLGSTEIVCLSGSLPPDSALEDWQSLLDMLVEAGKQVWIDSSGAALHDALMQPDLAIKVNGNEIGEVLGIDVRDAASARRALDKLGKYGLRAAAITLGSRGAVLATRSGAWLATGPVMRVVSTVGSGDAFLGGLVSALDAGKPTSDALGDAVAAGTANALSVGGGCFSLQDFQQIREQVQIEPW